MPYSCMLVDDEEDVINAIRRTIDWESLGFSVPTEAHNGLEALEFAEDSAPDVVLTDIKMPYMDGLELAHRLKELYPNIRIVVFSGFDEFEYAREALRLEAEEYILKPIHAAELSKLFLRIRERLDAERERKRAELENDPVHLAAAAIQAAGSEDVALNWFPSLEAYKKAHAERKPLETELAEHMEDYAKKIDTEIMTSHLTEESIVRAMQTPKAYHRRIAIEMAALRRRERMMQKVGGKEQDVHADAVAVRGDEFGAYKHIKELRDRAIAYYRNVLQGTSVENVHLGKVDIDENGLVEFTGSGRREAKSTSAKPEKLLLIKYLPKLIRGATNITENAAQKESHAGEYFYYLHTNASVDGTTVPVVITLIKRNDGSIQYYNHTLPSLEESIKKNRRYLRDQYLPMKPSAPRPSAILLSPLYHRGTW